MSNSPTQSLTQLQDWSALKLGLQQQGLVPEVFLKPLDVMACQQVVSNAGAALPYYEPRLIESHLESIWKLLERCLAYRREARDLEVLAVKAGADYALYVQISKLDEERELLRLREPQQQIVEDTQDAAATTFGTGTPLQAGFQTLAQGQAKEATLDLKHLAQERKIINERFDTERAYHLAYQKRHLEVGNAHNYAERREWLYRLMCEDLGEAVTKAQAASVGLKLIYDLDEPLPQPDPVTYLDEFVLWARRVSRFVESEGQHEVMFDVVVPLTQPWGQERKSLVTTEQFQALMRAAQTAGGPIKVPFDLTRAFLGLERVRLRSVGLSLGSSVTFVPSSGIDIDGVADAYIRVRATLFPPAPHQVDRGSRPHIHLGNVGVFTAGTPIALESGPTIHNVDPRGEWIVHVDPLITYKDDRAVDVFKGIETGNGVSRPIIDLKLHLRMAGLLTEAKS